MTPPHSFHIHVMGTGFTIDTPLKVARYGISSVVSLVDDHLVEKMREHYCRQFGEEYAPIGRTEPQARSRRIKAYLNLMHRHVSRQVEEIKSAPFEQGSEIVRYFELLDDRSALKLDFLHVLDLPDGAERTARQDALREKVTAGKIDVNIMTKLDRMRTQNTSMQGQVQSDAQSALKGFAESDLDASVVLSAGLNLKLFTYLASLDDFHQDAAGRIKKRVVLKVSDYRSAMVQGKVFARKGVWVSEYRIESGMNCGGHAFPTQGHLIGPILEEFKQKKGELKEFLFNIYRQALQSLARPQGGTAPEVRITAQGGIGTCQEDRLLLRHFELDGTGWGTPFLLVPETTAVDDETLHELARAGAEDVFLSNSSPLGVPFYNLKNSASEKERLRRIEDGEPGSPCWHGFISNNTEFSTDPACVASRAYQGRKIEELEAQNLDARDHEEAWRKIVDKSCICHDLGDSALKKYNIEVKKKSWNPAVCPGHNMIFFSKIASLQVMVSHIYGRGSLLDPTVERPHVFLNELGLYIQYLKDKVATTVPALTADNKKYFGEFAAHLFSGIHYYEKLVTSLAEESESARKRFAAGLDALRAELQSFTSSHETAFA